VKAAMSNFIQITPFMHVQDIEKTLAFFNRILGFETQLCMANDAYLHGETVGFRSLRKGTGRDTARQLPLCLLH
jgi:catechol 2,3-dioxygenase-like lactoylglutathione lyase family enzyme